ncbi:MAG: LysR family transcriptional regulator [Proteobacteria bacterium]|nr:LysR family transcriptional regulator [Pseudomonadota bacterium]
MNWPDYDLFCHVVERGSFSGAAHELGLPKSSVSAAISRLERHLNTRLIERTTRRLRLTEAGEALHIGISPLFRHLRNAVDDALSRTSSVGGTLRIAAPYEFAAHHLGEIACAMLDEHPNLQINIDVEYGAVNLFAQRYDIVFTTAYEGLPASSTVARRMFSLERGLFASPGFIARHDEPATPDDLLKLPLLTAPSDREWAFDEASSRNSHVPILAPRLRSPNAAIRLQAAVAGLGIARITSSYCAAAVRAGSLVRLLSGFECAPLRVYALMPARRLMPRNVRLFLDQLEAKSPRPR